MFFLFEWEGGGEDEEPSGEQKQRGRGGSLFGPFFFFLFLSSQKPKKKPLISVSSLSRNEEKKKQALRSGLHLKTAASPVPILKGVGRTKVLIKFGCINGHARDERERERNGFSGLE